VDVALHSACDRDFNCRGRCFAAQDGVLVPRRVIHVQQSAVLADRDAEREPLVAVGPPAHAEVVVESRRVMELGAEGGRAHPGQTGLDLGRAVCKVQDDGPQLGKLGDAVGESAGQSLGDGECPRVDAASDGDSGGHRETPH